METKQDRRLVLCMLAVMALLVGGCDFTKVRIGEVRMMYGTNVDGHISYNYSIFTGFEYGETQVASGQRIFFEYTVTVDKGSLLIEWQDPEGEVVWRKSLQESERGEDGFTVESTGTYRIMIQGKNSGGSFDVAWKIIGS
jgi:hypothetical protein